MPRAARTCSLCQAKNCAKGRTREALDSNRDLDNIKAQIIKHYQHLSDREAFVTAEMMRNYYQGFGSEYETLLRAFDKDCESLKRRVGKDRALGTYKLQVRSRNYVADFLQMYHRRSDISMQELTPDFIKEFAVYLSNDRGLASSTIWEVSNLKRILYKAYQWFPSFKRFLNMERECLQYGFNEEQTDKLLHGQAINYRGWLHSNEYRRNALADNVTAHVIRDEKYHLLLYVNQTPITQWFREQLGIGLKLQKGISI